MVASKGAFVWVGFGRAGFCPRGFLAKGVFVQGGFWQRFFLAEGGFGEEGGFGKGAYVLEPFWVVKIQGGGAMLPWPPPDNNIPDMHVSPPLNFGNH